MTELNDTEMRRLAAEADAAAYHAAVYAGRVEDDYTGPTSAVRSTIPDTADELAAAIDDAKAPADAVELTVNLVQGTHRAFVAAAASVTRAASHTWQTHPALFWKTVTETRTGQKGADGKLLRDETGQPVTETYIDYALLAQFTILDVIRTKRWDTGLSQWQPEYKISTDGVSGKTTLVITPDDLSSLMKAREAFGPAGHIATIDARNARFGDPLTQLRSYVEAAHWGLVHKVTGTVGRHPGALVGSDTDVFVLPNVTIGANGPTSALTFADATVPNAASSYVAGGWDDTVDLDAYLTEWVDLALGSDPSGGSIVGATLGWAAAAAWSSEIVGHPLTNGFPYLWVDATAGSGKSNLIPRIVSITGQMPANVAGDMTTAAQVRDTLAATIDVPYIKDEVSVGHSPNRGLAESFRTLFKQGYNARSAAVGGAYGKGLHRQRQLRMSSAVAFMGEALPQNDPAMMDRLISVTMVKRDYLPEDIRDRTEAAYTYLQPHCDRPERLAAVGAWYAWVLNHKFGPYLDAVELTAVPGIARVSNRNKPSLRVVLAGLAAYRDFLADTAPGALPTFDVMLAHFSHTGVEALTSRMTKLVGIGGTVAMLGSLAMLTHTTRPDQINGAREEVQFRLDHEHNKLHINIQNMCALLKFHERIIDHPLVGQRAASDEIASWPYAVKDTTKRRDANGSLRHWWVIDAGELVRVGGPALDEFVGTPQGGYPTYSNGGGNEF